MLVTGATGQQGGAVARHLLKDGWNVRALVRDPNKETAQSLAAKGIELLKGDLYDRASVDAALKEVYGVFGVQNFWLPDIGYDGEIKQGVLLADAAKVAGVQQFVYSSVGAAHRGIGQKHFESKWKIEQHIQKLDMPHTIVRPVAFMENYNWSRAQISNGVFQSWGLRPEKTLQLVAVEDIGAFVAIAFRKPEEFLGKTIEFAGDELTEPQMAETFSRVIGRPVSVQQPWLPEGQEPTPEQIAMLKFFNGEGYDADIAGLRKIYPG
ncbi:MAG: NmrA/HSCARG family protein, partial [Bacteroidota bacterium]